MQAQPEPKLSMGAFAALVAPDEMGAIKDMRAGDPGLSGQLAALGTKLGNLYLVFAGAKPGYNVTQLLTADPGLAKGYIAARDKLFGKLDLAPGGDATLRTQLADATQRAQVAEETLAKVKKTLKDDADITAEVLLGVDELIDKYKGEVRSAATKQATIEQLGTEITDLKRELQNLVASTQQFRKQSEAAEEVIDAATATAAAAAAAATTPVPSTSSQQAPAPTVTKPPAQVAGTSEKTKKTPTTETGFYLVNDTLSAWSATSSFQYTSASTDDLAAAGIDKGYHTSDPINYPPEELSAAKKLERGDVARLTDAEKTRVLNTIEQLSKVVSAGDIPATVAGVKALYNLLDTDNPVRVFLRSPALYTLIATDRPNLLRSAGGKAYTNLFHAATETAKTRLDQALKGELVAASVDDVPELMNIAPVGVELSDGNLWSSVKKSAADMFFSDQ